MVSEDFWKFFCWLKFLRNQISLTKWIRLIHKVWDNRNQQSETLFIILINESTKLIMPSWLSQIGKANFRFTLFINIINYSSNFQIFPADCPLVLSIVTKNHLVQSWFLSMNKLYEDFPAYSSVLLRQQIYLRTVRVTAAVCWRFHPKAKNFQVLCTGRRAGVRLYTSWIHLAKPCVFVKQSLLSIFSVPFIQTE